MSGIPPSPSTVTVSIISPNRVLGVPPEAFLEPSIPGTTYSDTPCLCFLIEHINAKSGKVTRMMFDLGIRKDIDSGPPSVSDAIHGMDITVDTPKDMEEILAEKNLKPSDIDRIIYSHSHFDHVGDLSLFPDTTELVIGPGSRDSLAPGYPQQAQSSVMSREIENRGICQISQEDFANASLSIKGLRAIDFLDDGSFYLLETPGHTPGHMSALARTTAHGPNGRTSTFMLLGGDVCHHAGALRPTQELRLHRDTVRDTFRFCPKYFYDALLKEAMGGEYRASPFYQPSSDGLGGWHENSEQMTETLRKVRFLDADPRVFVVLSHDHWLLNVVDLFPMTANDWYQKGWDEKARWLFLYDLDYTGTAGQHAGKPK